MAKVDTANLGPDDVRDAAAWSRDLLEPLADADWTVPAAGLDWSCRQTLEHIVSAFDRYSLYLASRATDRLRPFGADLSALSVREVLDLMARRASVLAEVVRGAPTTVRGFHPFGSSDPPGFVALAVVETVAHSDDIARGLGFACSPPETLCRAALVRLCPWAPTGVDPLLTLRWATGRADLPGHPRAPANWAWQTGPLTEWDGTVKTFG